jgi:hypothetical protein
MHHCAAENLTRLTRIHPPPLPLALAFQAKKAMLAAKTRLSSAAAAKEDSGEKGDEGAEAAEAEGEAAK